MDKYINKLNFKFSTNQQILNLIGKIDLYKGKWNAIEKQENIYLKERLNDLNIDWKIFF